MVGPALARLMQQLASLTDPSPFEKELLEDLKTLTEGSPQQSTPDRVSGADAHAETLPDPFDTVAAELRERVERLPPGQRIRVQVSTVRPDASVLGDMEVDAPFVLNMYTKPGPSPAGTCRRADCLWARQREA